MLIAKIIKSNSHVDYAARVLDSLETAVAPATTDYHFGQFVKIESGDGCAVGVIYNTLLINPEYGNYGPRLSTPSELNSVFSPDYLNEQGVLIGILMLGWCREEERRQGVPQFVLPIHSQVETMADTDVSDFHHDGVGAMRLGYYSHVITHAGLFAPQLLTTIVDQLARLAADRDRASLNVLRKSIAWQQTIGRVH